MDSMRDLELKVIKWSEDRNLFEQSTDLTRLEKFAEEATELRDAVNEGDWEDIKLDAGDVLVTVINLIYPFGLDLEDCLSAAYEKIKNRTGKMENGTFVKDKPDGAEPRCCNNCGWRGNFNMTTVCFCKGTCTDASELKPKTPILDECEIKTGWQGEEKAGNINLKFVDPATIKEPGKMAELHWNYIKAILVIHGFADDYSLNLIGFHYQTAFVHGFKHGVESK